MSEGRMVPAVLSFCSVALIGCATVVDKGQTSDIKYAYLIGNEYLVVCLEGRILGSEDEYRIEIPLNSTFLHPVFAVEYFEPIYTGTDVGIPGFGVPQRLIKRGCEPKSATAEAVPVPVVKDRVVPQRALPGIRAAVDSAATEYVNSFAPLDAKAGTVFLLRKAGSTLPNFIYASDRPLYGSSRVISLSPPSRSIPDVPQTVVGWVLLPMTIPVATSIVVADSMGGSSSGAPVHQPQEKVDDKPKPAWVAGAADPLLEGRWKMTRDILEYRPDGSSYPRRHDVCALEGGRNRMVLSCAGWFGFRSRQTSQYKVVGSGKYEFEVVEDTDKLSSVVGQRGTADYNLDGDTLVVTTTLHDSRRGTEVKTSYTYIRDRALISR